MKKIYVAASLVLAMSTSSLSAQAASVDPLVGRAWVETTPQSGLPGVMMLFMADGTLLMDSCWETYALRKWTRASSKAISWDEDGAKITAKVQTISPTALVLRVKAGKDTVEHRYVAGKAPYICPDMKR